jgi:TatD DNase family protein
MIDAHTHLYSSKYDHDRDQVIRRARESLGAVVISSVDPESLQKSLTIRRQHPDFIFVTAGLHPRHAARLQKAELADFCQVAKSFKSEIVALGEVGPDFHHVKDSHLRRRQLQVLQHVLTQAEDLNLPLVIHARQAEEAALEVVSRSRTDILFHCFNGSRDMARKITQRGFYLSFSAILLFSSQLQRIATLIPLELILTETDSPALSPNRSRRRNEPAFLQTIVDRLAQLRKYPPGQLAEITATNARRFYRLPEFAKRRAQSA